MNRKSKKNLVQFLCCEEKANRSLCACVSVSHCLSQNFQHVRESVRHTQEVLIIVAGRMADPLRAFSTKQWLDTNDMHILLLHDFHVALKWAENISEIFHTRQACWTVLVLRSMLPIFLNCLTQRVTELRDSFHTMDFILPLKVPSQTLEMLFYCGLKYRTMPISPLALNHLLQDTIESVLMKQL
jgi:hypothetical protein